MPRTETCPGCGSLAEIIQMGENEVLRCANCGKEVVITGKEEILPIEKRLVVMSLVIAIILLVILYYVSWSMIAHIK